MTNTKQKAYAYITRSVSGQLELLVFTQSGHPEAGIQVPGGTVDLGETPAEAAVREVSEETGLTGVTIASEVGALDYFHKQKQELQERHYFAVTHSEDLPDSWQHTVSSGSNDKGYLFDFLWLPISQPYELAGRQGEMIYMLSKNLRG